VKAANPSNGQSDNAIPLVWLLAPYRQGELSQARALVEGLGWPYEVKTLSYRKAEWRTNLFRGSDLRGVRLEQSDLLEPPWPDLVITSGMRNEPVCRWIKNQSGGRTRIVHIGKPWADSDYFDLVVTTPQYRLDPHPSVLHNDLTLNRITPAFLQAQAQAWEGRFSNLPRPYIAVMVGGDSGPYTFGVKAASRLASLSTRLAEDLGGSLLISTSSRTSTPAVDLLEQQQTVPHYFYRWQAADENNPYNGFLGVADALVVSADSISLLSEACATAKPVYMFDPGAGDYAMHQPNKLSNSDNDFRFSALLYKVLMRWGPTRLSRDLTLVHQRLIESYRAVWLGESFPEQQVSTSSDLDRAVQGIKSLFDM
jgi:mitochondrial fission protein ELM1